MKLRKAIISPDNKYLYEEVEAPSNKWITATPWAIQTNVLIQDYTDKIDLAWVDSRISQEADGTYKITGLEGGNGKRPLKCWMHIPLPFEDSTGWHSEYMDGLDAQKKDGKQYIVCIEERLGSYTRYKLQLARCEKGGWHGLNVIAWREIPRAKK